MQDKLNDNTTTNHKIKNTHNSLATNYTAVNTMQELAEYVGISRQTLSKYFNNPQLVGKQTQLKIQQALEETQFSPNLFATNLKKGRSNVIGIIIPSLTDPFFMKLVERIADIASMQGYLTFTLASNGSYDLEADALNKLQAMNVAGAFIVALGKQQVQEKVRRVEDIFPVIFLDSPPTHQAVFVGSDNRQSVANLVEYCLHQGQPPIFLAMPDLNQNAEIRLNSYIETMELYKEKPVIIAATNTEMDWQFEKYGYRQAKQWLATKATESCLLCANDRLAYGVFLAAWEANIMIGKGKGLTVAGHDDHPLAAYTSPPLTTVAQNYEKIAQTAVSHLLALIEGKTPTLHTLIDTHLVIRQSA